MPLGARLLYLMHVDWGWAKQRPHFIAEGLAEHFRVCVRFPFSYRRKLINAAPTSASLRVGPIWRLPFARWAIVVRLNRWLARVQLAFMARTAKIIWITHPDMYGLVEYSISSRATVIYDCMDDALEFPDALSDLRKSAEISRVEERLIRRANLVFTSSRYLQSKLQARYGDDLVIHVVNNGASVTSSRISPPEEMGDLVDLLGEAADAPGRRILYLGTISEWFDFDLILRSLESVEGVSYVLVGPSEITPPVHERIFVLPPVRHAEVARLMAWADALVMPFQVTELIRSVNPVKVYEYIESNRPAIVVRYGETEAFEPYVHLYGAPDEYIRLVSAVAKGELSCKNECDVAQSFVRRNSWAARVDTVLGRMAE